MNNFSPLELTVIALSIVLFILLCCFLLARGIKQCRSPFDVEAETSHQENTPVTVPVIDLHIQVAASVDDLYDVTDYFKPEEKPVRFGLYKTRFMNGAIENIQMSLWTEFGWRDPELPQFDCYHQEREWYGSKAEIAA